MGNQAINRAKPLGFIARADISFGRVTFLIGQAKSHTAVCARYPQLAGYVELRMKVVYAGNMTFRARTILL